MCYLDSRILLEPQEIFSLADYGTCKYIIGIFGFSNDILSCNRDALELVRNGKSFILPYLVCIRSTILVGLSFSIDRNPRIYFLWIKSITMVAEPGLIDPL